LKINDQVILILARQKKTSRALKLRKGGGALGAYFEDESIFLRDEPALLEQLRDGGVIYI